MKAVARITREDMQATPVKILRRVDVARYFGKSPGWVDISWREGRIPAPIQLGGPVWTLHMLEQFVEQLEQTASIKVKQAKKGVGA